MKRMYDKTLQLLKHDYNLFHYFVMNKNLIISCTQRLFSYDLFIVLRLYTLMPRLFGHIIFLKSIEKDRAQ